MTTVVGNAKIGEVESKIPDTSGLVTTTVVNTKIGEVQSKIPDTSDLVTATILDTNTEEVEDDISLLLLNSITLLVQYLIQY